MPGTDPPPKPTAPPQEGAWGGLSPEERLRLPTPARRWLEREISAGDRIIGVHRPPEGLAATLYLILQRSVTIPPSDATPHRCFGERAPGVPAVVVIEAQPVECEPPDLHGPEPEALRTPAGSSVAPASRRDGTVRRHWRQAPVQPEPAGAVARFKAGMSMDMDRWRDGTGHDLGAIDRATDAEREAILDLLLATGVPAPRDVEALARLGGGRAREALRQLVEHGSLIQRLAVLQEAPELASDAERTHILVEALREVRPFHGLSAALDLVADWHPAPVMQALWQAARDGGRERAVHAAALLAWLHGLAAAPFDWAQRPFYLQFGDEDAAVREAAWQRLRQRAAGRALRETQAGEGDHAGAGHAAPP
jgi:hypothetical protein